MLESKTIQKVKDTLVLFVLGAVVSMIPFYFQTNAMTKENNTVNQIQKLEISESKQQIQALEISRAIDATEIKQIKESLDRIERKLDKLIDENTLKIN